MWKSPASSIEFQWFSNYFLSFIPSSALALENSTTFASLIFSGNSISRGRKENFHFGAADLND